MKNWESDLEDLWLSVELNVNNYNKKIALCVVYMPPPVKLDSLQCFLNNVNNVLNIVDDVVILGDFNLGFIDWIRRDDDQHLSPLNYENSLGYSLVDFLSINGLHQSNSFYNADRKILDLVVSNISELTVTKPDDLLSKLDAHHPNMLVSVPVPNAKQLVTKYRSGYNFFRADYEQIKTHLKNINWYDTFRECVNANERLNAFYVVLQSVMDNFVPKYTKKRSKYPAWYSDSLIGALSEKEKFRQRYRKYKNPRDKLTFELLRSRCHTLINNCYNAYKCKIENDIPKNPKAFWRYIKDKRRGESCIPADMYMNDKVVSSGPDIANLFADQFVSVFSQNPTTTYNNTFNRFPGTDSVISTIKFTENQILNKLKLIDASKGAGPDSIPPLFILVVNGYESYPYYADSGVPQGSHLAPVLFILFINDITDQIHHCKYLLFADDLKIYRTITSHNDSALIQEDLDRIEQWCNLNHMKLNVQKCSHIRFTRKKQSNSVSYNIRGLLLETVDEVRDLGVIMDTKVNFRSHIDNIVTKSARLLGFLKRSTRGFRLVRTKIVLYNALVRSHLEFASVVWNPHYAVHSQRIESVQRAFTKHLAWTFGDISSRCPYEQRLQCYSMDTLRNRRLTQDLVFFYKLVNNKLDCGKLIEQIGLRVPHKLPRYPITHLFHSRVSNTNLGVNSPLNRLVSEINSLTKSAPDVDVYYDSMKVFKAQVLESRRSQLTT
uniref:SFRICE_022052 n=1 Tax=Spodoptera frugiperda TaxID=7108 RepID=A0A2H1VC59_SPOFR